MDFIPNPFSPLPPPAIFSNAVINDLDGEAIVPVVVASSSGSPPSSSTPPLILREDLFDVVFITQQEFLESIDGFTPNPMHLRSCPLCQRGFQHNPY